MFITLPIRSFCQKEEPSYYRTNVNLVIDEFQNDYMDENAVSQHHSDVNSIVDDIKDELKNGNLNSTQKAEYKEVLKFSTDVENVLYGLSASNMCEDKSSFYRGANYLGFIISSVSYGKFCVDFFKMTFKNSVFYFAENNSEVNYRIICNWSANKGMDTGNSDMGLFSKSVRRVYDNWNTPALKTIFITNVKCDQLPNFKL